MNQEEKMFLKLIETKIFEYKHQIADYADVISTIIEYCTGDYQNIYVPINEITYSDEEIRLSEVNGINIYHDLKEFSLKGLYKDKEEYIPLFTNTEYAKETNTENLLEIGFTKLLHRILENDHLSGILINPSTDEDMFYIDKDIIEKMIDLIKIKKYEIDGYAGIEVNSDYSVIDKAKKVFVIENSNKDYIKAIMAECNKEPNNIYVLDLNKIDKNNTEDIENIVATVMGEFPNENSYVFYVEDIKTRSLIEDTINNIADNHNKMFTEKLSNNYN